MGLEIKKELVLGHLSTPQKASFPLVAALGGMALPALIYFSLNPSGPGANGWGIPMATDIAFALGVLALFGKHIPIALKVFLLAVAIVDDLGAILIIAFFYTTEIHGTGLAVAAAGLGGAALFKYAGFRNYLIYVLLGVVVWLGFLNSGVHATIAGVLLGLLTPTRFPTDKGGKDFYSPLEDLVHKIHPWVGFGIMPLFAFANAGLDLREVQVLDVATHSISLGIIFGLLIGKPLGVVGFSFLFEKLGWVRLTSGVRWSHILGVGFLAGIGFTMSLFISGLALTEDQEVFSKFAIVVGSILSGMIGAGVLKLSLSLKKP